MNRKRVISASLVVALLGGSATVSFASTLVLPAMVRSRDTVVQRADLMVKEFATNIAKLTERARFARQRAGLYHNSIPFSIPVVVRFPAGPAGQGGGLVHPMSGDITLAFDGSGAEAFPLAYQQALQNVYNSAKPTLDLLFGRASVGGTVHVANFDTTIGDRTAIAGGYYLPDNGSGTPEIRFPVYNSPEAAAVNFLHTLLLAYLGPNGYSTDAYEEGLVRAVTMRVARTPGSLPANLVGASVEATLQNSYDIGSTYDWCNQRGLGGPTFIASNLLTAPLPSSGGNGPYLLRFLMSGSAWSKVLVEYPTFAAQLNAAVYADPTLGSSPLRLVAKGQAIMNSLRPADPTIEGLSFADWVQHQFALETALTQGPKVLVQPIPITSGLVGSDYGVFIIDATYFKTEANGTETLLSGTSYPIYWDQNFNRLNTSAQDEKIDLAASQGSVAPNFPDVNAGIPYRATVDVPVADRITRVFLPAGAIATAANTTPNDFYGTVAGADVQTGDVLKVRLFANGTQVSDYVVSNDAFGGSVGAVGNYNSLSQLKLQLIRVRGSVETVLLTRKIDKGPGSLAVDLRLGGEGTFTFTGGLPKGIAMIGMPIDPFLSQAQDVFGVPAPSLLLARYNSSAAAYDLFPNTGSPILGQGYFIRLNQAIPNFSITGRLSPNISTSVALKPGWNMVTSPLLQSIPKGSVRILHAADFPLAYSDAVGTTIGVDFFKFQPGTPDPVTGVPEGGTFVPATQFDPGVGYFVRVLSPEGVSLAFDPAAGSIMWRGPAPQVITPTGWALETHVLNEGADSYAVIGQTTTATNGFDPKEDSGMPPGIGGLQVVSSGDQPLFRDYRPLNQMSQYTLVANGLRPGTVATIRFNRLNGRVRTFKFTDMTTGRTWTMTPASVYRFTCDGTSHRFLITGNGR